MDPFDTIADRGGLIDRVESSAGYILRDVHDRVEMTLSFRIPDYAVISGALHEVVSLLDIARIPSPTLHRERIDRLSDEAAGLLARFAAPNAWIAYPERRATRDGDGRHDLAHLAASPEMLVGALVSHALFVIPGLTAILTDPRSTPREMAEALWRNGPETHLVISYHCFGGAPLDQGERRFYCTGRRGPHRHGVFDFVTGRLVVRLDEDEEYGMKVVAGLEANPDLAASFLCWGERTERQRALANQSMRGRGTGGERTPESLALDPLRDEGERLLIAATGRSAFLAYQDGIAARTDAWARGLAA